MDSEADLTLKRVQEGRDRDSAKLHFSVCNVQTIMLRWMTMPTTIQEVARDVVTKPVNTAENPGWHTNFGHVKTRIFTSLPFASL